MAILTLVEAGTKSAADEIDSFEAAINEYLAKPSTVDFLNDPDQAVHFVHRQFRDVTISATSIAALKKAIEDAGWKSVTVELNSGNLNVSFYVEEQVAPEPEPEPEPEQGGV